MSSDDKCLLNKAASQPVSICTAETRHLWHLNLSYFNMLCVGVSNHCLSLTIIICPLTLLVFSKTVTLKQLPGGKERWHQQNCVDTATLSALCQGVTHSNEQWLCWDKENGSDWWRVYTNNGATKSVDSLSSVKTV